MDTPYECEFFSHNRQSHSKQKICLKIITKMWRMFQKISKYSSDVVEDPTKQQFVYTK